jgi:hypothetical protein
MSAPSPDDIVIVDAIRTPITRAKVCALLLEITVLRSMAK